MLPSQRSACDRCRALKSRCSRESGAANCARCQRLHIDCTYSPPRRIGRPAKKRLNQETIQSTPSTTFRRSSRIYSNTASQTTTRQVEVFSSSINDASDFRHCGSGVIPSHREKDGACTGNIGGRFLGHLQSNDTKLMSPEPVDTDILGFLVHHDNSLVAQPDTITLTLPKTSNTEDSWMLGSVYPSERSHGESFARHTLPPSPTVTIRSFKSAAQRLIDLQSLLFSWHITRAQDADGLSTMINAIVHSTETLIDVVESLPQLKPSAEGQQAPSPPFCWPAALSTSGFATEATPQLPKEPLQKTQHPPELAPLIFLFMTNYILLLDSYEKLLGFLRIHLQCSQQSQWPNGGSAFSLVQPFIGSNTTSGKLDACNVVSFDLDVNSVTMLLSRMMKRLYESAACRFDAILLTPQAVSQSQS